MVNNKKYSTLKSALVRSVITTPQKKIVSAKTKAKNQEKKPIFCNKIED